MIIWLLSRVIISCYFVQIWSDRSKNPSQWFLIFCRPTRRPPWRSFVRLSICVFLLTVLSHKRMYLILVVVHDGEKKGFKLFLWWSGTRGRRQAFGKVCTRASFGAKHRQRNIDLCQHSARTMQIQRAKQHTQRECITRQVSFFFLKWWFFLVCFLSFFK